MDIKLNLKILKLFINNTVKQSERWFLGQPLVKGCCTTIAMCQEVYMGLFKQVDLC